MQADKASYLFGGFPMRWRAILVVLLLIALASPAPAGLIFGRKKKAPPTERVPELVTVLKTDGDENKRLEAVDELRQYDPNAFPTIVPTLIEALLNDRKPAVRAEAAQSLGRLRPVSQEVGQALEQALHNDSSMRVRLQARSALLQYHWSGYHGGKEPPAIDSAAKPQTPPADAPPVINTTARQPNRLTPLPAPVIVNSKPMPARATTQEPPLAPPVADTPPPPPSAVPRPLPPGPVPARSTPPPPSPLPPVPAGDGPALEPDGN
jgi:hypothetical protein